MRPLIGVEAREPASSRRRSSASVDENTSITQQTYRDCITQQLYALELDPPPDGVTVKREIHLEL